MPNSKSRRQLIVSAAGLAPFALWPWHNGFSAEPSAAQPSDVKTERAIFAGGCFWCVEADFDKLPGVLSTTSGYTGGHVESPSYEQVSSKETGHAEAVEVVYDPRRISYGELVDFFWHTIDPTTKDRQFCDAGTPYRTAIFALDAQQREIANASLERVRKTKPFAAPIVTEIVPAARFYPAEDYHQNYYKKNPVRYRFYRHNCGRDARLKEIWGAQAGQFTPRADGASDKH